jgi:aquaporin Z
MAGSRISRDRCRLRLRRHLRRTCESRGTIAFALRRIFPLRLTVAYVVAQFVGAFSAALILWPLFGPQLALGASRPGPGFSSIEAVCCEIVLTFAFIIVILMTAQEQAVVGPQAAIAVGFVVAACGLAGGGISGASMNPARSLAAQVVAGTLSTKDARGAAKGR